MAVAGRMFAVFGSIRLPIIGEPDVNPGGVSYEKVVGSDFVDAAEKFMEATVTIKIPKRADVKVKDLMAQNGKALKLESSDGQKEILAQAWLAEPPGSSGNPQERTLTFFGTPIQED